MGIVWNRFLNWDGSGKNRHDMVDEGGEAWDLLNAQNIFDLRSYEYAEILFEHQGQMFQVHTR